MDSRGIVFNIQRFCVDDGPGIRTTVFLKGCSMRCFWCHNPESFERQPQIQYYPHKCTGCGRCAEVCPVGAHQREAGTMFFDREKCIFCGRCTENCMAEALILVGKEMSAEEVLEEVSRDELFYRNSGGGVTFSGGEPLCQSGFLKQLLALCKGKGYHTAVESSLNAPWNTVSEIALFTGLFLADIKLINCRRHREATGCGNERILANIGRLAESGSKILIRVPVIPGVNDTVADMMEIACFVQSLRAVTGVELMPFHAMAEEKYRSLELPYRCKGMATLPAEMLKELAHVFTSVGITVVSNGMQLQDV